MSGNVILEKFLCVGDRVKYNPTKDTLEWRKPLVEVGMLGTVTGWYVYNRAYGRNESWAYGDQCDGPGIYQGNGVAIVRWDNGETHKSSASDFCFVDESLNEIRRNDDKGQEVIERKLKIEELPETAFWEGDRVSVIRQGNAEMLVIISVEYVDDVDYDRGRRYTGQSSEHGYTTYFHEKEATLISRGNYWWWAHDKSKLSFINIQDEVNFYSSLGKTEELRNPKNGLYAWTIDEGLEAVKNGDADYVATFNIPFSRTTKLSVFKLKDLPELTERLRQKVIELHGQD